MSWFTDQITVGPRVLFIGLSADIESSQRIRRREPTVRTPSAPSTEIPDDEDPNEGWSMATNTTDDVSIIDTKATDEVVADNQTDNIVANQSDNTYEPPKLRQQSE